MATNLSEYVLFGIAVVCVALGYLLRARRGSLWIAAACWVVSGIGAHYHSFWVTVGFVLFALWALIVALPVADGNWRIRGGLVFAVMSVAVITLLPTLSTMTGGRIPCPEFVKEGVTSRLVAGLDLRGGLRLAYGVDVDEAIKDRRDRYYDDMRAELAKVFELHSGDTRPSEEVLAKLREKAEITADKSDIHVLHIAVKNPADSAKIDGAFLTKFSGELSYTKDAAAAYTFTLREGAANQIRDTAVSQAKQIIERRVDQLGLREAGVSTRNDDIIVEVPGQDESTFREIREIIGQTARLEFKLLDDDHDFFSEVERQNTANAVLPDGLEFGRETTSVGINGEGEEQRKQLAYAFMRLQPNENRNQALDRLKAWVETLSVPPDREIGYELVYERDESTLAEKESGWRTYLLKSRVELTGELVRDAQRVPDQSPRSLGGWYVRLTFTDSGGTLFERITGANIKRRFAIILDDRVESAPVIQDRIAGGVASITLGSRDPQTQLEDARKLELVLRSGALPAPITLSNEQHIGPSLGQSAIRLGIEGASVGALLVLVFMLFYYHRGGLIADLAVAVNILLQLAILASFNASMTLPGIAGLALTVGMGVDCNVLFNERIREEVRIGKSPRTAVEIGFSRALSAIIDGHVTTLIAAIVLAQFGTGPIKGFAVTLMVGVACNIFTGVIVSRLFFDFWVRGMARTSKLSLG